MAKVIRVFGKADNFDIEFSRKGDKWEVDVPPDMTDGVYAVQLTAINENGEIAYWVGELYMCNGVCCIKINYYPYNMSLSTKEYSICFEENYTIKIKKSENKKIKVIFAKSNFDLIIEKRCNSGCSRN